MKVQCLFFSPTGNTRRIVESVSKGTGYSQVKPIDLTLPKQRELWQGDFEADLLIVGLPVYGSTYPSMMLPYLQKLKGDGHLAVPLAVCGNCKMGTALADMSGVLKKQGFKIPAAGNFVGEHTCATDEYRLGTGRPDAEDLQKAYEFGKKISAKLETDFSDITSTYGGQLYLQCYVSGSLDAKGYVNGGAWQRTILVHDTRKDTGSCSSCGLCVESCPTGAIDADTLAIEDSLCIRCFVCTDVCPSGLLRKQVIPPQELASWWKIQEKRRNEPLVFI